MTVIMNCYVLIGGASTRMGQPKVPLFLPRVVDAARPVFDQIIAVQRAGGERAGIETIFEDAHAEHAPVFGVLRALQHSKGDCFVLAVDYPLMTSDVLRFVVERFRASGAPLVAPRWNDKLQILCAAYAASMKGPIDERIASGRYDLRGLAEVADIIGEDELRAKFAGEPLMNVNTPEEWERAKTFL
jgi:molybdopterin-guanine dinucleotide biosynthesis protein A